jgi:predicted regulator of Ras-like GTPase activity (Roadblock/LC7/MglB family)
VTDVSLPPASSASQGLAFLELGERLRQRGQFAAAASVALAGLGHYPAVADAHDLLARIRADQGDDARAIAAWHAALECDPGHLGARKGLAFVAFRARDFTAAERQLELAAMQAPHDATVLAALDRVRSVQPGAASEDVPRLTDPAGGLLLYDLQGMRLAGGIGEGDDDALADAVAAEAAGLSREAARAARLLGLGRLRHLVVESADARVAVMPVADDAALLLHRGATMPIGRLLALAARAALAAHDWLGRMR